MTIKEMKDRIAELKTTLFLARHSRRPQDQISKDAFDTMKKEYSQLVHALDYIENNHQWSIK